MNLTLSRAEAAADLPTTGSWLNILPVLLEQLNEPGWRYPLNARVNLERMAKQADLLGVVLELLPTALESPNDVNHQQRAAAIVALRNILEKEGCE